MYKQGLALNNQQGLIYLKTKLTNQSLQLVAVHLCFLSLTFFIKNNTFRMRNKKIWGLSNILTGSVRIQKDTLARKCIFIVAPKYVHPETGEILVSHTCTDMLIPKCIIAPKYVHPGTRKLLVSHTCIDMLTPKCVCIIAPKYMHPETGELLMSQVFFDSQSRQKEWKMCCSKE